MSGFEGKTVVVTGGARGQGAAHTLELARAGATVYALDLLDELGAELEAAARGEGIDVRYRHHDVTSEDDWAALVEVIAGGAVAGLVNNAGIVHTVEIPDETVAGFDRILRVNVTGVFLGMRAMWPLLSIAGGSVVNTSSVYGRVSAPGYLAYTASKAAVLGMTKTGAAEGAPLGIRVNSILPGTVQTEQLKEEAHSFVLQSTPLHRGASPSELAQVVRFLLSDASSFITGEEIAIDGGFSATGFSVNRS